MEITRRLKADLTILGLTGRCVVSSGENELVELRSAIVTCMLDGRPLVALDLKGLASIDARGLGELVFAYRMLRGAGGGLALVAPTPTVRRMLAVTRLDTVLPLCESVAEAAILISTKPGYGGVSVPPKYGFDSVQPRDTCGR
jgi:anti-sigma B factor antagonist